MAYSKAAVIVLVVLTVAGSGSGHVAASGHAAATGASQTAEYRAKYKVPDGFLLGAGTGSYQTEGAWNADGKGENVFDHFFHQKGRRDQANGDVAADAYHRYVEDIGLAAEMKLNVYRFSISWTRIFSDGRRSSKNQKGVDHYHAVIDEIIKKGMTPMITISHFDHPQTLEDEFGGWLSDKMVDAFVDYADFVFSEYGHKVHHWVTVNEPNMHCLNVYMGLMAPGVWSSPNNTNANIYRCIHTQILAHTAAYNRFQEKYNADKKSVVGLAAVTFFARPNTTAFEDVAAAARSNMFDMGLLLHPVVFGDYPSVVRETLRAAGKEAHLPTFTEEQSKAMKGAIDFLAVNVYFGQVVAQPQPSSNTTPDADPQMAAWRTDANVDVCLDMFTKDTGLANPFIRQTEWVMRDLLLWIKATFGPDLGVFFTENGTGMNETETGLDDWNTRAVYYSKYLREMFRTINEDQVKVLGYTMWSFLDDLEWSAGLMGRRFGIVHVDYETGSLNRTKKASAAFFQQLMEERVVPLVESPSSSSSRVSASFLLVLGLVSAIIRRLS